jgi:hypothetical protein
MSFRDRIRAWFKGETRREAPSKSTAEPSGGGVKDLEEFMRSRNGVEGYLEPKTAIYSTTLLLVAADGEYLRRPVKDRDQATAVCQKHGAPIYDAAKVGYPKRMRDYDRGVRRDSVDLDELPPWPSDDPDDGDVPDVER